MGNRIGSQKQKANKPTKEEKKKDKEIKKEKEKKSKKEKKEKKRRQQASGPDTDFDDSSHVTGGDSESCVFHSAENVSSPYLDACTRSELEQSTTWSSMYESYTSAIQHPKVLSSKDFKDGFSLEACIPPEIARPETYDDGTLSNSSRFEGRSSVNSRKSNNSVKSNSAKPRSGHATPTSYRYKPADDVGSVGTSSQASAGGGYHTPLLSTPIFSRVDRPHSPASGVSSPLSRVQESDPNDSMDIAAPTTFHHPHFYNHLKTKIQKQPPTSQPDFRHLPKPTSPQPQRRALSPKMTSSPFKRISSDDSSSSPTTPTPQRRATNLLDLLRSGSKGEKSSKNKSENKQAAVPSPQLEAKLGSKTTENEGKIKSKPMWKTWERSAAKKSEKQNKVSIFGTTRKTDKKKCENILGNVTDTSTEVRQVQHEEEVSQSLNNDKNKSMLSRVSNGNRTSSRSSDSNLESSSRGYSGNEEEKQNRNSSPPVAKSAAFCIMRLEELERSIEKTIREKFPDAEPFLLRKRSKDEELKGSRSLPSTPSLKKKLYVVRDVDDMKRNSQKDSVELNLNSVSEKLNAANGNTRVCAETFESTPSPAMSPVVLRRFGARTRHASISPKIPRAKTAALYNSPSEMTQAEESMATKTVTKVPVYHALSTTQVSTPSLSTQFMKPLTPSQKSASKYDNVMDESEPTPLNNDSPKLVRQYGVEENDSDEVEERTGYDNYPDSCQNPVLVPTFSAVFGSVSPKLRRHLQSKFDDISKQGRKPTVQKVNNNTSYTKPGTVDVKTKQFTAHNINQQGNNLTSPKGVKKSVPSFPVSPNLNSKKYLNNETGCANNGGVIQTARCKETTESATSSAPPTSTVTVTASVSGSPVSVSIKNRMTPLSKSHSEGRKSGTTPASGAVSTNNSSHLYSAGKLHTETTHQVPDEGEMGATLEHPRRVEEVEKSGIHRKHSTDHVIFGSAVALPCRVYTSAPLSPTLPGLERSNNVNISTTAPAQDALTNQQKNILYVKKQKSGHGGDNKRDEQSGAYCSEAVIKQSVVPSAADTRFDLSAHSVPGLNQLHGNDKQHGDATYEGDLTVSKENIVSDPSCKQGKIREIPEWGKSTVREENKVGNRKEDIYVEDVYSKQKSSDDRNIAGRYQSNRRQEEQNVAVLRQPVSKVISEMINISKQEQLRQKQQGIQQPQANPEYGVKHVMQAVAVVSSPTYEQPCLTLEAKTVRGEVLHAPPVVQQMKKDCASKVAIESRCQEIQTDSYTTADKSVDSNGLHNEPTNRQRESQPLPLIRDSIESRQNAKDKLNEKQVAYSSDESEFLKMVLASKDLERSRNIKDTDKDAEELDEHAPPPPSPTAVQQLLEEFSEEEEESDAQERKEIEMAMRKESEIKQFTDKIYKRLSNLIGSQEEMDDDVFVDEVREKKEAKHEADLGSKYEKKEDSFSSGSDDEATLFTADTSVVSSCDKHLSKVMTIETSSSLTTTTSSDSEIYEEPSKNNERRKEDSSTGFPKRNAEPNVFIFPEMENAMSINADDARQRRSSREYHSDDDVATGRGIPDYYDDRPLWSNRQKPPGQLSAAMMAIRRRERRERWLKKRRRNKTDLLSTGSSDNCSEISRDRRSNTYIIDSNASLDYDEDEEFIAHERMILKDEMGSGILTSPKYSKPILPFFSSSTNQQEAEPSERDHVSIKIAAERQFYRDHRSKSNSDDNRHRRKKRTRDRKKKSSYDNEDVDVDHDISDEILSDESENEIEKNETDYHPERFSSGSNLVIPGIEETFNELMSVKHILEELQERKPAQSSSAGFMPLTQENVKSVREYYKDCYSSGNGRRSRMSATDRTESDLDIYSETRDDESTDSNFNADDEEDDDGLEPYATADDDHGATDESRSAGLSSEGRRRRDDHHGDDDDSETNVVVSCTFYNSNAFAAAPDGALLPAPAPVNKPSLKSTPNTLTPTAQASLLNSDEEFWAGNAAADETFKQIETAADAVSSTFQNAREQMHDIQHHLQALRRQMETMQDDLTSTSMTLTPDTSAESHVLP